MDPSPKSSQKNPKPTNKEIGNRREICEWPIDNFGNVVNCTHGVYETKMKGKFVIKLTNNNLDHFDSDSNKKKMASRNIKVVDDFKKEDDSMVVARRISRLFKQYTEKEIMEEIRMKKQIEVQRVGLQ